MVYSTKPTVRPRLRDSSSSESTSTNNSINDDNSYSKSNSELPPMVLDESERSAGGGGGGRAGHRSAVDQQQQRHHYYHDDEIGAVETVPLNSNHTDDPNNNSNNNNNSNKQQHSMISSKGGFSEPLKLLIGVGGIYSAFLYYGSLQEDVFRYESATTQEKFTQAWFLQVLEAAANVIVGFVGMHITGATKGIPLKMFAISGATQVTSKACTSLSLANGLSFPVATLAKSGKMAPVMAGSLLLGGATYTVREYLQVVAIIGGTAIVSMGKKKDGGATSSLAGLVYILLSLTFDGITAGVQKRLQRDTAAVGCKPKPYDFMYWTNLFMCGTAFVVALGLGEITSGMAYCLRNPEILSKIVQFSICSAVGQSFIFYTLAHFDPLVLSTVTTTRKIFSVLISIIFKGNSLSILGWSGINLACLGIFSEMQHSATKKKHVKVPK